MCLTIHVGAVLDGNCQAARLLSHIVHHDVEFCLSNESDINQLGSVTLPEESIGIWIDPIGAYDCILYIFSVWCPSDLTYNINL